jgi:hypothetical protein
MLKKFTVQRSYNQPGKLGVLGLLARRKINNSHVVNTRVETDPDQVHQPFQRVAIDDFDLFHSMEEVLV